LAGENIYPKSQSIEGKENGIMRKRQKTVNEVF
jgi:hypothetical protein